MIPLTLSPSMFEEWYPQDGSKITTTTNNIGPMKRVIEKYFSMLYDCKHAAAAVVELLRRKATGAFAEWYSTPGLLHEQLKQGIEGGFMFRPPIFFGTREFGNPIKEHVKLVVQYCGYLEVPMLVLKLEGWPTGTLEDPPSPCPSHPSR